MKHILSPASVLDNVVDLYIRVSSTEQAEEGYSVGEQEARLRNYSAAMGYTIQFMWIPDSLVLLCTVLASSV